MSAAGAAGASGGAAALSTVEKRKNLNEGERRAVIAELLRGSTFGALARGDFTRVALLFKTNRRTIASLWKRYELQKAEGVVDPDINNRRKRKSGRKGIDLDALREALGEIPIKNRTTQRSVALALGIPQSTLTDNLKKLGLHASSRYLKSLLTDDGKQRRLDWAMRWVRPVPAGALKFQAFDNFIHLDEKWFYLCKNGQTYYLYDDEELPQRKEQHKSHITKVMFLAAVARPRRIPALNSEFSGKLGIFPFTEQRAAQRNSRNRAAGTMETMCVEVTKERYKRKLLDQVIPAIKRDWPQSCGRSIFCQQDNAPSHGINDDPDIVRACTSGGWDIKFINQPPNSPDLNVLDLGFFNSIQSLQDRATPRTVDDLVAEIYAAFAIETSDKLGNVWVTLQTILQEILLAKGDNTFKLPHLNKAATVRRGATIAREMPCSTEAWEAATGAVSEGSQV